jgi:hypothetical protein
MDATPTRAKESEAPLAGPESAAAAARPRALRRRDVRSRVADEDGMGA